MALQTQNIDLKLIAGADTKTDDKNVLMPGMQSVIDSRQTTTGAFRPRDGLGVIATLPSTVNPFQLTTGNRHLVAGVNNELYSVGQGTAIDLGASARGILGRQNFGKSAPHLSSVALSSDGRICVAWIDPALTSASRLSVVLIDAASDRILLQMSEQIPAPNPIEFVKVVALGTQFVILNKQTTSTLVARRLNPTTSNFTLLSWAAPTATSSMRVSAESNGSLLLVAYNSDSTNNINFQSLVLSGTTLSVVASGTAIAASSPVPLVAVSTCNLASVATFCIAAVNTGTFYTQLMQAGTTTFNPTASSAISTDIIPYRIKLSPNSVGQVVGSIWGLNSATSNYTTVDFYRDAATHPSVVTAVDGTAPVSGSAADDTKDFLLRETMTPTTYGSIALVQESTASTGVAALLGVGNNVGQLALSTFIGQLSNPVKFGNKVYYACTTVNGVDNFVPSNPATDTVVETVKVVPNVVASLITWDTATPGQAIIDEEIGQQAYIGTGYRPLTRASDPPGAWPEPLIPVGDLSIVTSGTDVAGTISYVFAKVWYSPDGAQYRTYSEIFTAKVSANKQLQFSVRAHDIQNYFSSGFASTVELYRTERNGAIFYLSASTTIATTMIDPTNDAGLITKSLADINGDELPGTVVPSARAACRFGSRIAVVPADNPNLIQFNKPTSAPAGLAFAPGIEVSIPTEAGPIVGLATQGSLLYAFMRNAVFGLAGDPAGATGEGSTLSNPIAVLNGVGCKDARSIVNTPKGIMYKSEKGFHLLMKNQESTFLGAGPYSDRNVTVVGSGIGNENAEVYFALSTGVVWVYNLDSGMWYKWTTNSAGTAGLAVTSSEIALLRTGGVVDKYDPTMFADGNGTANQIKQDMTTGWARLNGIRGFQRVRRLSVLGTKLFPGTPCTVTIDVLVDYSTTPVQTITLDVAAGIVAEPLQLDIHLQQQKCEAMAFRLRTSQNGVVFSGATLEVGVKEGRDKSRTSSGNAQG